MPALGDKWLEFDSTLHSMDFHPSQRYFLKEITEHKTLNFRNLLTGDGKCGKGKQETETENLNCKRVTLILF